MELYEIVGLVYIAIIQMQLKWKVNIYVFKKNPVFKILSIKCIIDRGVCCFSFGIYSRIPKLKHGKINKKIKSPAYW